MIIGSGTLFLPGLINFVVGICFGVFVKPTLFLDKDLAYILLRKVCTVDQWAYS